MTAYSGLGWPTRGSSDGPRLLWNNVSQKFSFHLEMPSLYETCSIIVEIMFSLQMKFSISPGRKCISFSSSLTFYIILFRVLGRVESRHAVCLALC